MFALSALYLISCTFISPCRQLVFFIMRSMLGIVKWTDCRIYYVFYLLILNNRQPYHLVLFDCIYFKLMVWNRWWCNHSWCRGYVLLTIAESVVVVVCCGYQGVDLLGGQKGSCLGHSSESQNKQINKTNLDVWLMLCFWCYVINNLWAGFNYFLSYRYCTGDCGHH